MYLNSRLEWHTHKVTSRLGRLFDKKFKQIFYIFKCDSCEGEYEKTASQISTKKRLSNDYKHFCPTCFTYSLATSLGKAKYRETLDKRIGEKSVDACGYVTVYVANTHPYSDGYCGRVREHILVMENHLCRALEKGEVVHHIDGDKTNNLIDNLDLCTVQEHNACHGASETLVFELYKRGLIGYSRETKRYYLKTG